MNNQNTNNWNAGMEMMAAMMSMFGGAVQQPKGYLRFRLSDFSRIFMNHLEFYDFRNKNFSTDKSSGTPATTTTRNIIRLWI